MPLITNLFGIQSTVAGLETKYVCSKTVIDSLNSNSIFLLSSFKL